VHLHKNWLQQKSQPTFRKLFASAGALPSESKGHYNYDRVPWTHRRCQTGHRIHFSPVGFARLSSGRCCRSVEGLKLHPKNYPNCLYLHHLSCCLKRRGEGLFESLLGFNPTLTFTDVSYVWLFGLTQINHRFPSHFFFT
jgi:hypothetical protein